MKLASSTFRKKPCDLDVIRTHSALLVIDMQCDFTDVERLSGDVSERIQRIVPPLKSLISACRESGMPIIYTQEKHRANLSDYGIELDYEPEHCIEGSGGEDVIPELTPFASEERIIKRRYSAFYQTDLELYLRANNIQRLLLAGIFLDVCVLHTAFDAKARDFWIYVPRECSTAETGQRTDATFEIIDGVLGYVGPVDDVLDALSDERLRVNPG